jgi:hypothetical protein
MNLRKSGFTQHRANQDVGNQNNRFVAHFFLDVLMALKRI